MNEVVQPALLTAMAVYAAYAPLPAAAARLINYAEKPREAARPDEVKKLYLTFDDGPDREHTPELLDLLAENKVRASFFMVADFARENRGIVERAAREGHLIGLHSYRHSCALLMSPQRTKEDIEESFDVMRELGVEVRYFRAPWGLVNLAMERRLARLGAQTVFWDVMAEDWRGDTTAEIIGEKLRRRVRNGSIVCLHDGRGENDAPSRTIEALRAVLPEWKREGYRFMRIDER